MAGHSGAGGTHVLAGYRDVEAVFSSVRTQVLRVVREADGARLVLKIVARGSPDRRGRWRLAHEASLLQSLDVPGVVRTHGLVTTGLGPALVLDEMTEGTLQRLVGAVLPVSRCLQIGARVARALEQVHARQISHRDINPSNIAWDEGAGEATLIDFGHGTRLSRESLDPGGQLQVEGTLGYLSPEQTGRMNRSVDRRTDLYSLGATLYELVGGQRPFEGSDPIEILHATVARPARRITELRPDVPPVVADLLARLLAKDADDRYQEARAVADDLERCVATWAEGTVAPFPLGSTDRRSTLLLPERLYGREADLERLEAGLEQARGGVGEVIGVLGAPGVGKTALIHELVPRLGGGRLVTGGCDPRERTPYLPVLQILRRLLSQALDTGPGSPALEPWHEALGADAGLLLPLLPELKALDLPEALPLPPREARERIIAGLVRLLRAPLALPLVLFIDDLQWMDGGSVEVLDRLLASPALGRPLLLLAWRDGEVPADHPVRRLIEAAETRVLLGPLRPADVAQLLADALSTTVDRAMPLAEQMHDKTAGNPLFVQQLIESCHADGLLHFDGTWRWSIDAVRALPPTANVAALLARRLRALPARLRETVGRAACVGRVVDLGTLAALAPQDATVLCADLLMATNAGLLVPVGEARGELEARAAASPDAERPRGTLRFAHDEIHAAALTAVAPDHRSAVHLAAGRHLLATGSSDPFAVADQLNRAGALLVDAAERHASAGANLAAGVRAQASAAFDTALHYLEAGIALLGSDAWDTDYRLAFDLHRRAAECLLMTPEHPATLDFATAALEHATDPLDRVAVQRVRILDQTARYEVPEAVRLALEALSWIGVDVPRRAHQGHALVAVARTFWRVRGRGLEDLATLPECTDPRIAAALGLLADTSPSAYYTNANLVPVLLCRMVDLSLIHGVSPYSAIGFASFAFIQLVVRGNLAAARMWSAAARRLMERFDSPDLVPRVELLSLGFVESRGGPLAAVIEPFGRACWQAREVGDAEYTGLCALNHTFFSWLAGVPLSELRLRAEADLETCRAVGQGQSTNAVRVILQSIDCFEGRADDPGVLSGAWIQIDDMLAQMEEGGDLSGVAALFMRQAGMSLLFGTTDDALWNVAAGTARLSALPASPDIPPFHLLAALTWLQHLRETGRRRGRPRRRARWHRKALKPWVADGPMNHAHKAALIDAELADLDGDVPGATAGYDEAIRLARRSGLLHEEAICVEWALRAALRAGLDRRAAALLAEARVAWLGWGAEARVPVLDALAAELPVETATAVSSATTTTGVSTTGSLAHDIDFVAVTRASRALAGTLELEALLATLLTLALEDSGATRGALLLGEDEPTVAATAAVGVAGVDVEVLARAGAPEEVVPDLARIARNVWRTQEPIVVHDGRAEARWFPEPAAAPRSVLCVPVRKGGRRLGVVALANDLTRHAFTEDRHEVVGMLCAQAAVFLENAGLYADLRKALDQATLMTAAFERFVPKQFLEQLGRSSVLEVGLGDQVERTMTVLFMDIRNFTGLSERLTPEGTFELVNALLARLGPIIRRHGGFIDKYIGDAIMALFPRAPDDALSAAIDIQAAAASIRSAASEPPASELAVGVGIHHGVTMLGVVGEAARMDTTVISDAVNVASRLEGLTKRFGVETCVSEAALAAAEARPRFSTRALGTVEVRGKTSSVEVHALLGQA